MIEVKSSAILLLLCLVWVTPRAQTRPLVDTTSGSKKKVKDWTGFETGQVGMAYEYGLLPYVTNSSPPKGNLIAQGSLGFSLKQLPWRANFYYATARGLSGVNNYLSFEFDAQRFRQQLKQDLAARQLAHKDSLNKLMEQRNALQQKLAYLDHLNSGLNLPDTSWQGMSPGYEDLLSQDSLGQVGELNGKGDSLRSVLVPPQVSKQNLPQPPEVSPPDYRNQKEYQKLKKQSEQLDRRIRRLEQLSALNTDSLVDRGEGKSIIPGASPWKKAVNGLQKFSVGLVYPDHSTFLVSRIPVRGVDLAWQFDDYQFYFTHGKTLQPLFSPREMLQNQFNPVNNLQHFFDLNNVDQGRRITVLKGGYGAKEQSHLHGGILIGKGKTSYWDSTSTELERNYVLELDGRWNFSDHQHISLIWGRSHTQIINPMFSETVNQERNRLLDLGERSHAMALGHEINLRSTRTRLNTTLRWVDPFFKSHGVRFIRSDNLRYRVGVKQGIGRKLKVGGFVSREEDNLLKLYDYKTVLFSYGVNGQYRPWRSLSLQADYRPFTLSVDQQEDLPEMVNRNWMANFTLNWMFRRGEFTSMVTGLYSRYQLAEAIKTYRYENLQLSHLITAGEKVSNELNYNFFYTNDTVGYRNTHLLEENFTFHTGKFAHTALAKAALSEQQWQWGYGWVSVWKPTSWISCEFRVEKMVLGENYYISNGADWQRFPYYSRVGVNLLW